MPCGRTKRFDEVGRRVRTPLKHGDRERAKEQVEELASQFRRNAVVPERLTLERLFDMYDREGSRQKPSVSKRKHDARCREMFVRFLGAKIDPKTLSRREWDQLIVARRAGALRPVSIEKPKPVG